MKAFLKNPLKAAGNAVEITKLKMRAEDREQQLADARGLLDSREECEALRAAVTAADAATGALQAALRDLFERHGVAHQSLGGNVPLRGLAKARGEEGGLDQVLGAVRDLITGAGDAGRGLLDDALAAVERKLDAGEEAQSAGSHSADAVRPRPRAGALSLLGLRSLGSSPSAHPPTPPSLGPRPSSSSNSTRSRGLTPFPYAPTLRCKGTWRPLTMRPRAGTSSEPWAAAWTSAWGPTAGPWRSASPSSSASSPRPGRRWMASAANSSGARPGRGPMERPARPRFSLAHSWFEKNIGWPKGSLLCALGGAASPQLGGQSRGVGHGRERPGPLRGV